MKKICLYILIVITLFTPFTHSVVFGADIETEAFSDTNYQLLQPLPDSAGGDVKVQSIDVTNLPDYINTMFLVVIGLSAILAVLYISYGGIIYMSTDAVTGKKEGKEKIKQALWGLLIILGCFLILQTINPTILNLTALNNDSGQSKIPGSKAGSGGAGTSTSGKPGQWCIKVYLDGKPYNTDCGEQSTCSARIAYWDNQKVSAGSCYVSNESRYDMRKYCTDLTINGTAYKKDCGAGEAYTENTANKGICNTKMDWYVSKGYLIAKSCYENNNKWCIDVSNKDGSAYGSPDCSTGGQAYIENQSSLSTCESKRSYWAGVDPFINGNCELQK